MTTRLPRGLSPFALVLGLALLAGCGESQPSRFYMLSSLAEEGTTAPAQPRRLAIGIRPVGLPTYLDRPQVVTRSSPNQVELAEFNKWAEPLKETIPRVLARNLSVLLGTTQVYVLPRRRTPDLDYEIEIDILRLDVAADGTARLDAQWRIVEKRGGGVTEAESSVSEPVDPDDYEAIAAAYSRMFGALSGELAKAMPGV